MDPSQITKNEKLLCGEKNERIERNNVHQNLSRGERKNMQTMDSDKKYNMRMGGCSLFK